MPNLNITTKDDLNNFIESFKFIKKNYSNSFVDIINDRMKLYSSLASIEIKLFIDGDFQNDLNSDAINTVVTHLDDVDEDSEITLTLTNEKPSSGELIIFDFNSFIPNIKITEKCTFWDKIFNTFECITYLDNNNSKHSLSFTKLPPCSVSPLNKFNQTDDKPNFYNSIAFKALNVTFENELKVLSSFYFLKNICSAYDFESNESFEFEGFRSFVIPNVCIEDLLITHDIFMAIFEWLTIDKHISSKLGILRNVISLSKSTNITECFDQDLLNSLESNFKIYLKDNINQYFEVKNKVSEFIYDLSNRSFELLDKYTLNANHILLAVLSYFFTVVLFTTIDKNNSVTSMLTYQLGTLSSLFILVGVYLLYQSKSDLDKKALDIVSRMTEIKARYNLILAERELNEMFTSPTLEEALKRIKQSKTHCYNGMILLIILAVLWALIVINLG
jgi:hypothetical protein